jgi:predicted nucleotidyltransferase
MKICLKKKQFKQLLVSLLALIFLVPQITLAAPEFPENKYPRLANCFLKWDITNEEANELSKWDILILSPQIVIQNPMALDIIKNKNPKIKILAYVLTEELPLSAAEMDSKYFWRDIYDTVNRNNWWLKDASGNHINFWPNTWMINITDGAPSTGERWYDFFPRFVSQKIISSGPWDGIFFDNSFDNISWINNGNIDINNDGEIDTPEYINQKWQEAMNKLFVQARILLGPDKILVANSSDFYNQYLNGRLYESFPGISGGWQGVINIYTNKNNGYAPFASIINVNTNNTDNRNDFKKFRYGLASALLGDGFYSFDRGDQTHRETWWYDEYEIFLGKPVSSIKNLNNNSNQIREGIWKREFQNGIVLINSSQEKKSIDLGAEFEKIRGSQDTAVNDGSIITSVELNPNNGLILLRPIEKIIGQVFTNASFVRIFNPEGQAIRNGFFAYFSAFRGNTNIITKDLDNNGSQEIIVAENNRVEIYNSENQLLYKFFPYGEKFNGGINITLGDLNNDGYEEIITGAIKGGPHIRIFNFQGKLINPGFFAYDKNFRGGVNLALGDIDGDGQKEIVTAPGLGGGPQIKIFNKNGKLINPGFFAYDKNFRGGVNLALGDIDGDGKDEIIAGKGLGGEPQIKIFNNRGKLIKSSFFAFDKSSRNGVKVIAYDFDNNGRAEILAASSNVFTTALIKK